MTSSVALRLGALLSVAVAFLVASRLVGEPPRESIELLRESSVALWFEGRFDEAEKLQLEVVARAEATPQDVANLACTYLRRVIGERSSPLLDEWTRAAEETARRALARDPDQPAANWVLGAIASEFGGEYDSETAVACFERIVRRVPADLPSQLHFAEECEKLDRREEAIEHHQIVVDAGLEYAGIAIYRTALYRLFRLLQRRNQADDRERAAGYMKRHEGLPESTPQEDIDRWVGNLGAPRGVDQWVPGGVVQEAPSIAFESAP